jgi:3-oxoacyl-[acyl-carrier protein] reductase
MRLKDRVAIITGAVGGIGRATAIRFASEGARVVAVDMYAEGLEDTVRAVSADYPDRIIAHTADVTQADQVTDMVDRVIREWGVIHVLVNNAGIVRDTLLLRMKQQDWDKVIQVNMGSVFQCTQAAMRTMIKQRFGRIINLASVVGVMGNAGQSNYSASKAGVIGFTKSIAKELGSRGITVNAIAPGYIETPMTQAIPDQAKEAFISSTPLGRPGQPEDVAGLIAFLASDDGAFITGQVIHVDGGMVM